MRCRRLMGPRVPASTRAAGLGCKDAGVDHRHRVASGSPFEATIGFSRAVRVGDRVVVAGTAPVLPGGGCPADVGDQARRCLEIIEQALTDAGSGLSHVVRTRMFLTSAADAEVVGAVHGELLGETRPAATMVVVAGLLDPAWKVEIEAEAVLPEGASSTAERGPARP